MPKKPNPFAKVKPAAGMPKAPKPAPLPKVKMPTKPKMK